MSRLSPQWKGLPNAYKQPGRWTYADHLQYAEHLEDEAAERRRLRQEAREILAEPHNEPLNNFAQPLRFEAEDAEIRTYAAKVAHAQGLAWAACLSMLSALPEGIEHHAAQLRLVEARDQRRARQ